MAAPPPRRTGVIAFAAAAGTCVIGLGAGTAAVSLESAVAAALTFLAAGYALVASIPLACYAWSVTSPPPASFNTWLIVATALGAASYGLTAGAAGVVASDDDSDVAVFVCAVLGALCLLGSLVCCGYGYTR